MLDLYGTVTRAERPVSDASLVNDVAVPRASGRRTAQLVGWQSLAVLIAQLAQGGLVLLTAWLVDPSEFALWAIASFVFNIGSLVANLGLGPALIYRAEPRQLHDYVDTALVLSLSVSAVLIVAVLTLAPVLSALLPSTFDSTEVERVVRVMGIVLVVVGPTQVAQALLERRLRFPVKAGAEIAATMTGTALTIGLLAMGAGIWALVWGRVAVALALLTACWVVTSDRPRIPPRPTRVATSRLLGYGIPISAGAVLMFLAMNTDTLIMGGVFGANALGQYALAFTIANAVPTLLIASATKVAFPLYVQASDDPAALSRHMRGINAWAAAVMGLVTLSLALVGREAVPDVLGADWTEAGNFLAILSIYGLASVGTSMILTFLLARGHPGAVARSQLVWLGGAGSSLAVTISSGSWSVPFSFSAGLVLAFAYVAVAARKEVGRPSLSALRPAIMAAGVAGPSALLVAMLPGNLGYWPFQLLTLVSVYCVMLVITSPGLRTRIFVRHSEGTAA
jgi:O-antigen/teichoic acid export membrane protein